MALIHIIVQRSFVRGYLAGDKGDQVFMMCKLGLEKELGIKLRVRDEFLMESKNTFIEFIKNKFAPSSVKT